MAEWDHAVPVRETPNPTQPSRFDVSNNTLSFRIDANMFDDQLLNSLYVDPTAPLDFGRFDLAQITGVSKEESSEDDDFGIVPMEPYRDGMVPIYHVPSHNSSMIVVRKNNKPTFPPIVVSQPTSFHFLVPSPAISVKPTTTQQSVSVKQGRHWRAAQPPPRV